MCIRDSVYNWFHQSWVFGYWNKAKNKRNSRSSRMELKSIFLVAPFPSRDKVSKASIITGKFSLKTLMLLCFSLHLVSQSLEILGINFLLKIDSRKNEMISLMVPTMFWISGRVLRSLITRFSLCKEQWKNKALVYFLCKIACTPLSVPDIVEQPSNPKPTHFSGLRSSFAKNSSMVCAMDFASRAFSSTNAQCAERKF